MLYVKVVDFSLVSLYPCRYLYVDTLNVSFLLRACRYILLVDAFMSMHVDVSTNMYA